MTPDEFIRSLQTRAPAPAYLFIGPEGYDRDRCRRALVDRMLPPDQREDGFLRHDLDSEELAAVLDDAQSFSLFARIRVIWVSGAEGALPRGRAASDDAGAGPLLAGWVQNPVPDTVIVFDCSRYELEGDDKARAQRVAKFYDAVPVHVEFARYSSDAARRLATQLAKDKQLRMGRDEIELLTEVLSNDAARIANEIEKLALYAGAGRPVTAEDIWNLTPNAKASTIFKLVESLGRRDRAGSLASLDVLVREGEYLPLALSFLGTQFRMALVAKEAKLNGATQVQAFFTKQGMPIWRGRAEQVAQTAAAFPADRLRGAVVRIYETDKALRDTRPDDRVVMEKFILDLTAA